MKEINSIFEKLSDLCEAAPSPSVLEIDLMLDYTRKIYDELLSERKKIVAGSNNEKSSGSSQVTSRQIVAEPASDSLSTTTAGLDGASGNLAEKETKPEPNDFYEEHTAAKQPEGLPSEHSYTEYPPNASEHQEETGTDSGLQNQDVLAGFEPKEDPYSEQKLEEKLYFNESNISFEPPHPAEEEPFFPEEGIEEEQPEENAVPLQSIPVPLTGEDVLSDYAQIFNYASKPKDPTLGDIRKLISINDKYLFLNELFNSQKKAYEETLDKLNTLHEYKEAVTWIKNEIAPPYKWYEDDETVLDFYDVLARHFSAR